MKRFQLIILIIIITSGIGFSQNFENAKHLFSSGGEYSSSVEYIQFSVLGESIVSSQVGSDSFSGNIGFLVSDASLVTSIEQNGLAASKFSLYPNPCRENINFTCSYSQFTGKIRLFNIEGTEVYYLSLSNNYQQIDLSRIAQGVYCVIIYDAENRLLGRTKIVKF